MKKRGLYLVIILIMVLSCACKKESIKITAKSVKEQTIAVSEKGKAQVAIVTAFDKDYYNLDELITYINKDVESFNSANGTSVTFNSAVIKDQKVNAVFDFVSCEELNKYMSFQVSQISASDAKVDAKVPDKVKKYGKSKTYSKSKAIKKGYKVLVIDNTNGNLKGTAHITVDGKIKFGTNITKVDSNTAKVKDLEGVATVVFQP